MSVNDWWEWLRDDFKPETEPKLVYYTGVKGDLYPPTPTLPTSIGEAVQTVVFGNSPLVALTNVLRQAEGWKEDKPNIKLVYILRSLWFPVERALSDRKTLDNLIEKLAQNGITIKNSINFDSTGQAIADAFGIRNDKTNELIGGTNGWNDIWLGADERLKVLCLMDFLRYAGYFYNGGTYNPDMEEAQPNIGERTGQYDFAELYKSVAFGSERELVWEEYTYRLDTYIWQTLKPGTFNFSNPVGTKVRNKFTGQVMLNKIFFGQNADRLNLQNEDAVEKYIQENIQTTGGTQEERADAIRRLQAANFARAQANANLVATDSDTEEIKKQRDAFFSRIEQCCLLIALEKIGKKRKEDRILANNAIVDSGTGRPPYGDRVSCISVDSNLYMNYSDSTGKTFDYSANLIPTILKKIKYGVIFSKIQKVKPSDSGNDDTARTIEMPLLFEGSQNFLYKNRKGLFKHVKVFQNAGGSDSTKPTVKDLIGTKAHNANKSIMIDDISIKFHGENQATAKTNVDVDITISIGNLLLMQTFFESSTSYVKADGSLGEHTYQYSLIDFITYLHRSDLGDIYKNLNKGGARLYNPVFSKDYNRLSMKIVPRNLEENPSDLSGAELNFYKEIKDYIENTPLILDLALVDHTIEKENESQIAKIKISYKGYIKSFLQNPQFDLIRTVERIEELKDKEIKFIEELVDLEDKEATDRIDNFNKANIDDVQNLSRNANVFYEKLRQRGKIYSVEVPKSSFEGHVSRNSFQLRNTNTIYQDIGTPEVSGFLNATDVINSGSFASQENFTLKYAHLGDLVEVSMENIWDYNPDGTDELKNKDFPLKVIMPSFYPLKTESDGSRTRSKESISLADFPISLWWFQEWWIKEIKDTKPVFYTIGTFINRILNDIVNQFLMEDCYLMGSHERMKFATKSEIGLWNKNSHKNNVIAKNNSIDFFKRKMKNEGKAYSGAIKLKKDDAPFFKKDPKFFRNEYCNYIYVYPVVQPFKDIAGVEPNKTSWKEKNIPYIARNLKTSISGLNSQFVRTISFSKEESNYRRESRFQSENLYTLAQLASVYNITANTAPALDLFPGMLVWVNAGFYQSANVLNSIPNILGLGGYHIVESVTHKAKVGAGGVLNAFTTDISANWVSNGSIKVDGETPSEQQTEAVLITASNSASTDSSTTESSSATETPPAEEASATPSEPVEEVSPSIILRGIDSVFQSGGKIYWKISRTYLDIQSVSIQLEGDSNFKEITEKERYGGREYYVYEVPNNPGPTGTLKFTRKIMRKQ